MKIIATILMLCAMPAFAQTKKPATPAAKAEAPKAAVPPPADVVTPRETVDSLKLQLALEKQKTLQEQAQALQQGAMQAIEPKLQPLRAEYAAQTKIATDEEQAVRKENGYGPDILFDGALGSPTFGQWIKKKTAEAKK